jgi:diamine N-acetyltransferase
MFIQKVSYDNYPLEIIVIQKNNRIIGFISLCVKENNVGWIDQIGIDKNHRNKGYATILMNRAIQELQQKNVSSINLYVVKSNMPAQKLYQKLGFCQTDKNIDDDCVFQYSKNITI